MVPPQQRVHAFPPPAPVRQARHVCVSARVLYRPLVVEQERRLFPSASAATPSLTFVPPVSGGGNDGTADAGVVAEPAVVAQDSRRAAKELVELSRDRADRQRRAVVVVVVRCGIRGFAEVAVVVVAVFVVVVGGETHHGQRDATAHQQRATARRRQRAAVDGSGGRHGIGQCESLNGRMRDNRLVLLHLPRRRRRRLGSVVVLLLVRRR